MNRQEIDKIKADIIELNQNLSLIYDALRGETDKLRSEMEDALQLVSKKLKELRQLRQGAANERA